MFRVSYNHSWGSKLPARFTDEYFTRKPTQEEIIEAFKHSGILVEPDYFLPHNSGLITVEEIMVYF